MPYGHLVNSARRLIYIRAWGSIALNDFWALARTLSRDPVFDHGFAVVLDLTDADLARLRTSEIRRLAIPDGLAPAAHRAVVATHPEAFGLARMCQTHRHLAGVPGEVLVCRSLTEALTWMGAEDFIPPDFTTLGWSPI